MVQSMSLVYYLPGPEGVMQVIWQELYARYLAL